MAQGHWGQHRDLGDTAGIWHGDSEDTLGDIAWGRQGHGMGQTLHGDIRGHPLGTLDLGTASGDLGDSKGTQRFRDAQQALG